MENYKELKVWQKAYNLTLDIYQVTKSFPKSEKYGITSQIRRSVTSTPANIAEGFNRQTPKEYIHFLYTARGSLQETEFFCLLCKDLGLISQERHETLQEKIIVIGKLLTGLIKSIKTKI